MMSRSRRPAWSRPADRARPARSSQTAEGIERDGERAGREGDDNAGDDHRLRNRIEGEARRRAAPRDNAEHEKHAAADQIEGEQLAQRMRVAR